MSIQHQVSDKNLSLVTIITAYEGHDYLISPKAKKISELKVTF